MRDLPGIKSDLRVSRLTARDVTGLSDHFKHLQQLVRANELMYPRIATWFKRKVMPGIVSEGRTAYVAYLDSAPIVSAVLKHGTKTKICHLNVLGPLRDRNVGELFFSLMAVEARSWAREIHFTLPESLWLREHGFFKSFGFTEIRKAATQYRTSETELRCSSNFTTVWRAVLEKLPKVASTFLIAGHAINEGLIMSLKPRYAEALLNGTKRIEIRRKFSHKWCGCDVTILASRPRSAMVAQARIARVEKGTPDQLWENHSSQIGGTREEYDTYTADTDQCYAIRLEEVEPFASDLPIMKLSKLLQTKLTPPQSYYTLQNSKGWSTAVSVAALLNATVPNSGFNYFV